MPANMENSAVATELEKISFHSNPKEGQCQRMFKWLHNLLISHASKAVLKILQARLQWYMNWELPDVQVGFRKGIGTRDQTANICCWIIEKVREFKKKSTSASLTTQKPLTVWIISNRGKFLTRWEYQTTLPASWEIWMQDKKQQLEPDMEQWTGSKLGKEYVKTVYCHHAYLTSMQSMLLFWLSW